MCVVSLSCFYKTAGCCILYTNIIHIYWRFIGYDRVFIYSIAIKHLFRMLQCFVFIVILFNSLPSPPLSKRRYCDARRRGDAVCVCVSAALASAANVMRCIKCPLVSSFHELMQSRDVSPSVRLSVNILRKSLLRLDKWLDRHQTCIRCSPDGPASRMCSRSRSNAIAHMVKQFVKLFAIQYGLTFCLYMRSLYEAPLGYTLLPVYISIRQLDLNSIMSKSWNELLRH